MNQIFAGIYNSAPEQKELHVEFCESFQNTLLIEQM